MTSRNSDRGRTGGSSWSAHGSCPTGKWCYSDRATAKAWSKKKSRAGDTKGSGTQRPYKCERCPYWHLGHKPAATMRGEISSEEFHQRRISGQPVPSRSARSAPGRSRQP